MAGRSRRELDAIRRVNRAAMGMAGTSDGLGCGLSGVDGCCASCDRGGSCEGERSALPPPAGMSGVPGPWGQYARGIPGMGATPLSLVPPVRIRTAWPPLDATWVPGQSEPAEQGGPGWSDWLTRHVVRPEIYVGPIRVAPYEQEVDYSGVARALTYVVGTFGVGFGSYILYKAFWPGARS